jgi:hypothetical protein
LRDVQVAALHDDEHSKYLLHDVHGAPRIQVTEISCEFAPIIH